MPEQDAIWGLLEAVCNWLSVASAAETRNGEAVIAGTSDQDDPASLTVRCNATVAIAKGLQCFAVGDAFASRGAYCYCIWRGKC